MMRIKKSKYSAGFTLVELLVTMVLTMVVIAPMYSVYENSSKNYTIQNEVTEAENNLRAAIGLLNYDLKTVGYDPTGTANVGITSATATGVTFTTDENGDGTIDAGETISYSVGAADANGHFPLLRGAGVVAENIQAIEFYYNDTSTTPADLTAIRKISVSVLAVTEHKDPKFGSQSFPPTPSGALWTTAPEFRGKFMILSVYCRNMGL